MEMTDKEFLEAAAKAAGIDLHGYSDEYASYWTKPDGEFYDFWNPLTDDGDAFRLAVKLKLQVHQFSTLTTVQHSSFPDGFGGFDERHDRDPYAATRRAIVRAAAEIGKGEPK